MEEIWNAVSDVASGALDVVGDAVSTVTGFFTDGIGAILSNFFYSILYKIGTGLCWVVNVLDQMFAVMSGLDRVSYDGKQDYLIKIFFGNSTINNVYWGMALIGILLCFVFAIIAVARKAVDSGDKIRQSLGGILTGLFKGILIIVSLTVIMNMVLTMSDLLLRQVSYLFDNADNMNQEETIVFDDEEYAAMARVLDTIGNYSLNPSYNSRYNLNRCFNEIRSDLQYLKQRGVFTFYYVADPVNGESWQSALQKIVNAADLDRNLSLDVYNEAVSKALISCMDTMRTDYSFKPLKSYTRQYAATTQTVPLDRMVFLMCTMEAAKNKDYNKNASMQDGLRSAYYVGEKDLYDLETVSMDFELSEINYIILFIVAFKMIWDLAVIIINCVARLFNMIFLYIIAPPFIATIPLDEGGKLKQWTTAFIVQCFSVFGSIIAMRVLLLFIPIVIDSKLVLLPNSSLNLLAKMVLILGGMSTAKRASSVITGILADNAGMQAIHAGDMGESVRQQMNNVRNYATGFGQTSIGTNQGYGLFGKGWEERRQKKDAQKDREEAQKEKKEARREKEKVELGQPARERQQAKKAQAKEQWRADMLAAVRAGSSPGGHSTPGGEAGGGSSGDLPGKSGGAQGGPERAAGAGGSGGAGMGSSSGTGTGGSGGAGTMTDQQYKDLFGVSKADYEARKADGGTIPQAPDISQTSHFDEGRDWLPDGDVLTADSFASDKAGADSSSSETFTDQQFQDVFGISRGDFETGRAGGPGGSADVGTASTFTDQSPGSTSTYGAQVSPEQPGRAASRHPRKAPPPPRSSVSGTQEPGEKPLPNSNRK